VAEYYDLFKEPSGDEWVTATTVVTDPAYLTVPFVTTTDFRKERMVPSSASQSARRGKTQVRTD